MNKENQQETTRMVVEEAIRKSKDRDAKYE